MLLHILSNLSWATALFAIVSLFAFLKIFDVTWLRPKRFESFFTAQGIPTTGYTYLVGNLPQIRRDRVREESWRFSTENARKYGRIFVSFFGPFPRIVVNSASHLQDVFVKKASLYMKPDATKQSLEPLLGKGLVTSEGELWKRQRTTINPAFHFVNLKAMVSLMTAATREAVEGWAKKAEATADGSMQIEAHKEYSSLTLDIIASTSFGSSFRDNPADADAIYHAFTRVIHLVPKRNFSLVPFIPILRSLPIFNKTEIEEGISAIKAVTLRILADRRAGKNVSLCEGRDLLDLLLEARDSDGQPMPEQQIKDELMTFVLAGHETTSNLLVWLTYQLTLHPEIQDRCVQEIDRVVPNLQTPNYDAIKQLRYLDATIDETLRFHPPVAIIARQATEDHVINGTDRDGKPMDIQIPKGAGVQINIRAIHRDPIYWKDPDTFDPTRFLASDDEDSEKKPRYAPCSFLPFAAGPRSCIGSQFAKIEAKVIMSHILQRYRLELVPGQKVVEEFAITVRSKYGLLVKLTKRNQGQ